MSDRPPLSAPLESSEYFFGLTPERVLAAVESSGFACTGRCTALNSFENRVYDVELDETETPSPGATAQPRSARHRIVKFYRPGRWSEAQISEEHEFLADLRDEEIPAVAPLPFPDGRTLHQMSETGIWYAIFPKVGGRAPDELTPEQLLRIGRLLARVHAVGARRAAPHRLRIDPDTYGARNLEFLLAGAWIAPEFARRYEEVAREILRRIAPWFAELPATAWQRVHGDCHLSNLIWSGEGPFFVDFDDMVRGPAVQDIWLLSPGRDEEGVRNREMLLEGYAEMRAFDRAQLRLIEPLRALRYLNYTAWVARRWKDPAFPAAFPEFGTHRYWADETRDLEEQLRLIGLT